MSKIIICLVDASLNWYFLYTVRKRLVKYHGLKKYTSLVRFNFRLMVVSMSLDVCLGPLPLSASVPPDPSVMLGGLSLPKHNKMSHRALIGGPRDRSC